MKKLGLIGSTYPAYQHGEYGARSCGGVWL